METTMILGLIRLVVAVFAWIFPAPIKSVRQMAEDDKKRSYRALKIWHKKTVVIVRKIKTR